MPLIGLTANETCETLLLKYIPSSPDEIFSRGRLAVNALLDPNVPPSVAAEFDFGVGPNPDSLQSVKMTKFPSMADEDIPHYPLFKPEANQPILLDSQMPRPESRLSYFGGDFFSDSYFARHQDTAGLNNLEAWKKFIQHQPWLEWVNGQYVLRLSGASERILNATPGDRVTLYRGTVPQEFELNKILNRLSLDSAHSQETSELKTSALAELSKVVNPTSNLGKKLQDLVEHPSSNQSGNQSGADVVRSLTDAYATDLFGRENNQGALFVTTSLTKAKQFTKGSVISYSISKKALQNLIAKNTLYVGVENEVEMAFIGPDAIRQLSASMIDSSAIQPSGNIWPTIDTSHSIWR
jgi:hypothetical protein